MSPSTSVHGAARQISPVPPREPQHRSVPRARGRRVSSSSNESVSPSDRGNHKISGESSEPPLHDSERRVAVPVRMQPRHHSPLHRELGKPDSTCVQASEPPYSEEWRPSAAWSLRMLFPELRHARKQMLERASAALLDGDHATHAYLMSGLDDATMSTLKDMFKPGGDSHARSPSPARRFFDSCQASSAPLPVLRPESGITR